MAYDEELAERVRELVEGERGITEKRMFGGLAMLLNGNMAVAIRGRGGLLVRSDPDTQDDVLTEEGAAVAEMRGRLMPGWITVDSSGCTTDTDLRRWVDRGMSYARTLPAK